MMSVRIQSRYIERGHLAAVTVQTSDPVVSGQLVIQFDPTVVVPGMVTPTPDVSVAVNRDISGTLILAIYSPQPVPVSLEVNFYAMENAKPGDYALSLVADGDGAKTELYDSLGVPVPVQLQSGVVRVV